MSDNEKAGRRDTWAGPGHPYISDEEFERMVGGDRRRAIDCAVGAASMSWEPTPTGEFRSDLAAQIGDDLARYLEIEPNLCAEEASWLLVLLDNAIPREAMGPNNWEGKGREYAEKILKRIAEGGSSDLEKRHMAIIENLKPKVEAAGYGVPISAGWILEQLGEKA